MPVLLLALAVSPAVADTTTPAAYPRIPAPEECNVQPVSIEEVSEILATPIAATSASPAPFAIPAGKLADGETATEVVAVLHQVFACTNAGDYLRVYAFFSDNFVRDFFAGTSLTADVVALLTAPPQPLPEDQRRIIRDVGPVRRLADNRAGVLVVLDEPDDPRREEPDYVILKQVAGRWFVDEIHEDVVGLGTPTDAP
jgi:hypothetical protein